jgi:two-component system, chemotaxis family, response regulator Rcp1
MASAYIKPSGLTRTMQTARRREMQILLIEDNPGDVRLVEEALKQGQIRQRLTSVTDGLDALAFLRRQGTYSAAPRPDLIVLDLNLPRKDGREVLAEIKATPELSTIPVVVFSGSHSESDVIASYGLQANCYITKPVDLDQFVATVRAIGSFWGSVATLPPQSV